MKVRCSSTIPYTIRDVKITWLLGCILSSVGYGILISLGWGCFTALRSRETGNPRINKALTVYVVLAVILATVAQALDIHTTINGVLDDACGSTYLQPPNPYIGPIGVVFLVINLLTDGLLVWRCFAVTKTFQGRLWSVMWLVPLAVYIGMVATGIVGVTVICISSTRGGLGDILVLVQFGVSALLNALITLSIVTLIVQHRRMLSKAFGSDKSLPYLSVLTVLIESAGLILIIDVFVIVTISLTPIGNIAFQLWIHSQPIASLLIIYRVSRNIDCFHTRETRPETPLGFSVAVPASPDGDDHWEPEIAERIK